MRGVLRGRGRRARAGVGGRRLDERERRLPHERPRHASRSAASAGTRAAGTSPTAQPARSAPRAGARPAAVRPASGRVQLLAPGAPPRSPPDRVPAHAQPACAAVAPPARTVENRAPDRIQMRDQRGHRDALQFPRHGRGLLGMSARTGVGAARPPRSACAPRRAPPPGTSRLPVEGSRFESRRTAGTGRRQKAHPRALDLQRQRDQVSNVTSWPRSASLTPSASVGKACPGSPNAPGRSAADPEPGSSDPFGHRAQLLDALLGRQRRRADRQGTAPASRKAARRSRTCSLGPTG